MRYVKAKITESTRDKVYLIFKNLKVSRIIE